MSLIGIPMYNNGTVAFINPRHIECITVPPKEYTSDEAAIRFIGGFVLFVTNAAAYELIDVYNKLDGVE